MAIGVVVAVALVVTGCSSSKKAGTTTTTGAAQSTGQAATDAATAQQIVAQYTNAPTTITQTQSLSSAPPTGKTFVWLECDISSCTYIGQGLQAAMQAAGWTYKQVNYQSANPASLTAAFNQALTLHPTVVGESGVPPEAGWSSVLPAYKAAGVPIITSYVYTTNTDPTIIANIAGPTAFAAYAKLVANWFIADSGGTGKALIQRVDAYPILKSYSDALVADIKAGCAKCDVSDVLQNSAADASDNGIVPSVVSALRRDPSVKYLLPCDLEFFDGLPSALAAADLNVKTAGQNPDLAMLGFIKSGKIAMAPSHPLAEGGWVMADAAFNWVMNKSVPADDIGALPTFILNSSANFSTTALVDYPIGYEQQFKALWHVG